MKGKNFVLALVMVVVVYSAALADFSVNWGVSSDNPGDSQWGIPSGDVGYISDGSKDYGYEYIGYYLWKLGYASDDAAGELIAQNNYLKGDSYFWKTGDYNAYMVNEFAGYKDTNSLGFYQSGDLNTNSLIFAGSDGKGATKDFNPGYDFGLYLDVPQAGETWYTDRTKNGNSQKAHGLIYALEYNDQNNPVKWLVAWEDKPLGCSDKDYNDMIVTLEMKSKPVPEPISSSLFLLGAGAFGLKVLRRKKNIS